MLSAVSTGSHSDGCIVVEVNDGNHSHVVYQNLLLANKTLMKT